MGVSRRHRLLRLLLTFALTASVGSVSWLLLGDGGSSWLGSRDPSRVVAQLDLPWPQAGQASVEVEGLGKVGTRGEQVPVAIASLTKVMMTAYVVLKEHPLTGEESGPEITVDREAGAESFSTVESTAPLRAGDRLSQRRLLELMLLPSGSNVARLLARWDAGSQEAFVAKMNRSAAQLRMEQTTYTDASGIKPTTRSTSEDQLKLARAAMANDVFRSIVSMRSTTAPGTAVPLRSTNKLLDEPGVIGLKTGSTTPAGGNLLRAAVLEGPMAGGWPWELCCGKPLTPRWSRPGSRSSRPVAHCWRHCVANCRGTCPDAPTGSGVGVCPGFGTRRRRSGGGLRSGECSLAVHRCGHHRQATRGRVGLVGHVEGCGRAAAAVPVGEEVPGTSRRLGMGAVGLCCCLGPCRTGGRWLRRRAVRVPFGWLILRPWDGFRVGWLVTVAGGPHEVGSRQ
ncbi:hypothetical protein SSP24_83790 [Streptomyces spinoverrucosus]|uniref:Peptidase S11 D-alanyl-D-alanine carboxypeptidase A N-terminal domain-containing protein n=1 Tax=Streptomyces spinoverrucosus TaxID=284043 RepID=A0A4Y3VUT1_9ACTN|nr:hypothetical protein SSP24_83790 [Streptomyces spinoverrucosus]GHB99704.1 hypothetical protein GCM10010397_84780 [Streptomyces spinoverrucosus]